MTAIGSTKYGMVQSYRPHGRPEHYICACCVMSVGVPQDDGRYCSTCRAALDGHEARDLAWLRRCAVARDELREIDRCFPGHLDQHAWRYLHEDGQDLDEIESGAVAHEEARRESR